MKYFKVILVLFLFLSCKNNKVSQPEKPDNLLSEKEMVDIIYDMSIMSAAKGVNKKLLEREGIQPESFIYDLHDLDSVQFSQSNDYYTYDLKTYERTYNKVKQRLEKDKGRFDSLVKEEKRIKDSLALVEKKKKDSVKGKRKKIKRLTQLVQEKLTRLRYRLVNRL
jgi:hypothetical protein